MLTNPSCSADLLVDIVPLYGSVRTLTQKAGKDLITNDKITILPPSLNQRSLKVTSASEIVKVLEVYSPNLVLPTISKGVAKYKVKLQDFGPTTHAIRVPFRMLRQHIILDVPSYSHPYVKLRGRSFDFANITKLDEGVTHVSEVDVTANFDDDALEIVEQELDNESIVLGDYISDEKIEIVKMIMKIMRTRLLTEMMIII